MLSLIHRATVCNPRERDGIFARPRLYMYRLTTQDQFVSLLLRIYLIQHHTLKVSHQCIATEIISKYRTNTRTFVRGRHLVFQTRWPRRLAGTTGLSWRMQPFGRWGVGCTIALVDTPFGIVRLFSRFFLRFGKICVFLVFQGRHWELITGARLYIQAVIIELYSNLE